MGKGWDSLGKGALQRLWHKEWLAATYRVLKPGGVIKAFNGTRTMHHLAQAMEEAGFVDIRFEAWSYGCLTPDAEVLTPKGWTPGVNVGVDDMIMCWNPETGLLGLDVVQETIRAPFSGEMVAFQSDDTDQLLTPNHRVYHWYDEKWQVAEAGALLNETMLPIIAGGEIRTVPVIPTRVPYEGDVWCVRVPTGAFVARRNGKMFVTGNSGFPKSLAVAKKLDQMAGAVREMKRTPHTGEAMMRHGGDNTRPWIEEALKKGYHEAPGDTPVSSDAVAWDGWGTALKPAWEPIVVGRKPE